MTSSLTAAPVLRPYQQKVENQIYEAWALGARRVLAVLPTGAGKTVTFSNVIARHAGGACAIAHRQELVGQIASALNRAGVRFRVIAPSKTVQMILRKILREQGTCHYDPKAPVGVAGVDTLVRIPGSKREAQHGGWLASVTLVVQDEVHHCQAKNKWGSAFEMFTHPECKGLGVTATPHRTDGGGLSRDTDGCFDTLVIGVSMRELILDGYLTPYKIASVPCVVKYEDAKIGQSGDYTHASLVAVEEGTGLVGDIVAQYLKFAPGKRGVTFVSSVARAKEVAQRFVENGVPAEAIDGTTDDEVRDAAVSKLASGELLQLVSVDLIGEGFDLPAVEVVSLGTKTKSLSRYIQWCGRALRLMLSEAEKVGYDQLDSAGRRARVASSRKPYALIIDHAGHVLDRDLGGPPDAPRLWQLGRSGGRSNTTESLPYRVCPNPGYALSKKATHTWQQFREAGWTNQLLLENGFLVDAGIPCAQPYERIYRTCPHCGFLPEAVQRSAPEMVEGDLELLDADKLEELYASMREALMTEQQYRQKLLDTRLSPFKVEAQVKHHRARVCELEHLKWVMQYFGGWWAERGDSDSMIQRRFFHYFGVDVLTAQTLKRVDAEVLRERIEKKLQLDGCVIPAYSEG